MRTTSQADLAVRLRLVIARTARRLRQEAGEELSPSQAAALATIDRHGPLTPSELAEPRARPAPDGHARHRAPGGGRARRAHARPGRPALVRRRAHARPGASCWPACARRKDAYLAHRLRDLDADERATLDRAAAILERVLEGDERA